MPKFTSMHDLKYFLNLTSISLKVIFRRFRKLKKYPNWSLKTEIIWATSRYTLLSSNEHGLPWLKKLSQKLTPKLKGGKKSTIESTNINGVHCLKISPKENKNLDTAIVYFHGGGYVLGSPEATLEFTSTLSLTANTTIFIPDYPKAPEQTYPEAHISAEQITNHLVNTYKNLVLMGDSAGAALVLSTYGNLGPSAKGRIKAIVLVSPWIEPLATSGSINYNAGNDIGDRTFVTNCYRLYLGGKIENPRYPMTIEHSTLSDLPPTFISIGSAEILFSQTEELKRRLLNISTKMEFKLYQNMFHTFWNHPKSIPEASTLIADISCWLSNKVPSQTKVSISKSPKP